MHRASTSDAFQLTLVPCKPMSSDQSSTPEQPAQEDAQSHSAGSEESGRKRRSWKSSLMRISAAIAFFYMLICGAMVYWESRLVFPGAYFQTSILMDPNRFSPDRPIVGKISAVKVTAGDGPVGDGPAVSGRLYTPEDSQRVILFLHGNGIHATEMDGWTRRLSDVFEATVFTAEYRGFESSDFTPTETSSIEDALAAIEVLSEITSTPVEEILIYGRSLGGGVAAGLVDRLVAAGTPPESILLDRTFDSVANVGADLFWFLPVQWLVKNRFDSVEALEDYRGNVVQIHGRPDRIVPMKNGKALHESLVTKAKVWIEIPDMRHNDRISLQSLKRLRAELDRLEAISSPVDSDRRKPIA